MNIISTNGSTRTRQYQARTLLVASLTAMCIAVSSSPLLASSTSAASAEEVKLLRAELKSQQKEMASMQAKLYALTASDADLLALAPAGKSAPSDKGYRSAKNWDAQLGGELEFEYLDAEGVGINPLFKIDQLYLYPKAKYKDVELSADIAVYTGNALIEEAWAKFSGLPGNSWIEVGLNDMLIANVPRKSEAEILIETAFYRDDNMGVRFGGAPTDLFYWKASVTNGLKLATKAAGEIDTFRMIHDDRQTSSANDELQLGMALGIKPDFGAAGTLDLMPFYYDGSLSGGDISFLQNIAGYGINNDANKTRKGVNVLWKNSGFAVLGQVIDGKDGTLVRSGWFAQPSYKFDNPMQSGSDWFQDLELIYRYSDLEVDLANVETDSLTWDRQQHIFGLGIGIIDSVKLKLEYFVNEEETGGAEVDNDELLLQFELKY